MTFNIKILLIVFFSLSHMGFATAHNKVVVIPMAGDDVPAELTPSTPIAKVNPSQSDYIIGALTVIDNTTELEWQRQDDDITRSWDDAWNYCANLNLNNYQDWRLPHIKELQSIFDYGNATGPSIEQVAFPNTNTTFYWSATSYSNNSQQAWLILFTSNSFNIFSTSKSNDNLFVRCVR